MRRITPLLFLLTLFLFPVTSVASSLTAIRGAFLDFVKDPFLYSEAESVRYQPDGLLVLHDGKIKDFGSYESLKGKYADVPITAYAADKLIVPGLIDTHIHYPQTRMLGAFGNTLLEW